MNNKDLSKEMSEIRKSLSVIQKTVTTLVTEVKGLNDKFLKQNGRVGKLEDKYEKSLIQDVQLNTQFKAHAKQDDDRFARIENKLDAVEAVSRDNKTYIKVAIVVGGLVAPILYNLIDWFLMK